MAKIGNTQARYLKIVPTASTQVHPYCLLLGLVIVVIKISCFFFGKKSLNMFFLRMKEALEVVYMHEDGHTLKNT